MPKTYCFLTSIFWGFSLDFGRSWASKMEPSWPFWDQKTAMLAHLNHLKIDVFLKSRLGGLRARFWRPRASILEGFGPEITIPPLPLPPFRQALATINFSTLSTLGLLFPPLTLPPFQQALPTINCSTLSASNLHFPPLILPPFQQALPTINCSTLNYRLYSLRPF